MIKKILISGGAGFIGSNLALRCLRENCEVTVLDTLAPQIHGEDPEKTSPLYRSIKDKVRFIKGSVCCREDWEKALDGQDAVVHLAAETGTGQSMYKIQHYTDTNIGGTGLLLDILTNSKHTVKKLVVASSRAVYGEGRYQCPKDGIVYPVARNDEDMKAGDFECRCPICGTHVSILPTAEDSKLHPSSIYGITKQCQEEMVLLCGAALGIPAIAFRYQNVYGPGQSLSNPYTGILSIFSTQILNGNGINIFEDGKESRDFVFIDDVVDATFRGVMNETVRNAVFNVGTGERTDVLTVANTLIRKYGREVPVRVSGEYRVGDIRHNFIDVTPIRTQLGFEPQWNFERGITAFADWVKTQEVHEDKYAESIKEMKERGLYK